MDCEHIREALSARLDGEDPGLDPAVLEQHVAGCPSCTAWGEQLDGLHRRTRVRPAEPVPDLSAAIMARAPGAPGAPGALGAAAGARWGPMGEPISTARWALFVIAMTQLVLAGPALLLGEDPGAAVHVARELGTFDVALAVGLLVAAWQPARAWGLLPVAAALGLVTGLTAALDIVDGTASLGGEAHHVLDLTGVALLWWVAREARTVRSAASARGWRAA